MVIDHINNDKRDCRLANFRMITQPDNITAAYDNGRFDGTGAARKPVTIDGKIYKSVLEASKILSISRPTIDRRAKNPEWPTYFYINN
jgi:hypothetical protein